MKKPDLKNLKVFFILSGICTLALIVVVFIGISFKSEKSLAKVNKYKASDFDHNAKQFFEKYKEVTPFYMEGVSTKRTLNQYYSLRQYPGSPPYITHEQFDDKGIQLECLSCHEKGGFAKAMKSYTPVSPHPQHTYCIQCHVKPQTDKLFKGHDWVSVNRPKLGRSALPGSPPPIVHSLQMRENCIACHVGPGTVVPIRVNHTMRGNCRQCHVPFEVKGLFKRKNSK